MMELIIGIAVGAAFSKFWLMIWDLGYGWLSSYLGKKD